MIDMRFNIIENGEWRKNDKGPHGQGIAINFKLITSMNIYDQTIKLLNACNEYFNKNNIMKYRLGVYPELKDPCFHVDIVQKKLFWIATYKRDKYGKTDFLEYKYCRDEVSFLNNLIFVCEA
jgi:hypothetical protein